jgi:hypothetical protein
MWCPEHVEHTEGLAGLIERWVLGRRRAPRRTGPFSKATRFSNAPACSRRDTVDHARASGAGGVDAAKPESFGGSDPAVLAAYRRWCMECARVTEAYGHWADSDAEDEADAWLAYEVALDRADTAYITFAQLNERAAD